VVLSTAVFDRHLPAPTHDLPLPRPVEEVILASKPPASW